MAKIKDEKIFNKTEKKLNFSFRKSFKIRLFKLDSQNYQWLKGGNVIYLYLKYMYKHTIYILINQQNGQG